MSRDCSAALTHGGKWDLRELVARRKKDEAGLWSRLAILAATAVRPCFTWPHEVPRMLGEIRIVHVQRQAIVHTPIPSNEHGGDEGEHLCPNGRPKREQTNNQRRQGGGGEEEEARRR